MNIGIFSGSFDPIHMGHVMLAYYIVEYTDMDEVWFLVSPQNPFKADKNMTDESLRMQMVQMALNSYPKLKASDFEFALPTPSYTINTLNALQQQHPEHTFTLVIGADNWNTFEDWKNPEEILSKYNLIVYPRLGSRISIPSKQRSRVEALESPIIEISSTFVRESIKDGYNVKAFLPIEVYNFIEERGLYK